MNYLFPVGARLDSIIGPDLDNAATLQHIKMLRESIQPLPIIVTIANEDVRSRQFLVASNETSTLKTFGLHQFLTTLGFFFLG